MVGLQRLGYEVGDGCGGGVPGGVRVGAPPLDQVQTGAGLPCSIRATRQQQAAPLRRVHQLQVRVSVFHDDFFSFFFLNISFPKHFTRIAYKTLNSKNCGSYRNRPSVGS